MAENVLIVNACLRGKNVSRTYELGNFFVKKYMNGKKDIVLKEYLLSDMDLKPFNKEMIEERDKEVSDKA